ncbi:MAG: HRDC domain-containing protein, partial [Tepidisphaeraceae bacterium]
ARLNGKFGVGAIADVLIGAENERVARWGHAQLSVFGLLRAHSGKRVIAMLHKVMEAGLARQRDPEGMKFRPVMELTASGVAVMKGEQAPPASLADLMPGAASRVAGVTKSEDISLDSESAERFERLRRARAELARARQLPAYCICHDSTLKLIARSAPRELSDMESVRGMGPHKIRNYGKAFIDALREPHSAQIEI